MSDMTKELAKRLGEVPLFSGVKAKERKTIATLGRVVDWPEGKAGVIEGSKAAAFYLILEGSVEVTRDGKAVARMNAGNFFGEMAMLTGGERNATVTAVEPTKLFTLRRPAFAAAIEGKPQIAIDVIKVIAERQNLS